MARPALFDLDPAPTTRTIALLAKRGGATALPAAALRAGGVRYQEVVCRSALNRVEGMPFRWTLNPYRGCTHGCHYCFARRYQAQFELDPDDAFSSVILVKVNFPEVLRRELAKPSWTPELVAVGTATDPYQPIEGRYRLTRRTLEVLVGAPTPIGLVTKGPLVVRDRDLLAELARRTACTVCLSVPSVDEAVWRRLEPGTAPPTQRLRALQHLRDAGIRAGVLLAPIVPGISSHPAQLERTIKASADHGAAFVSANLLHLEGGTREHFLTFLADTYPHLVPAYRRLYARKYAPKAYADKVYALVAALRARHGFDERRAPAQQPRDASGDTSQHAARPVQPAFRWEDAADA